MKPPRSVWVEPFSLATVTLNRQPGWLQYDLHRPKAKRNSRKGERRGR